MRPEDFHPGRFEPGAKHALDLEFAAAGNEMALPVVLVRGARPGKTLVATAGVHGDEFEGVRAILDTVRELDPAAMTGDFLAVPVANPPAFWNVSRTSPLDGGNLARVFPGRTDGGPTEAIAWHLGRSVILHADLYIDLHSAGVRCLMPSMVGYDAANPVAQAAAFAFGARVVWAHPTVPPGRTVSEARNRGIPALYTEARGAGRIDPADLHLFRRGILNLLRHLGVLPGAPETVPCEFHLYGDGNIDDSISSSHRGFLVPEVELLEAVRKGQRLGMLLDLKGACVEEIPAPRDGLVALIHACPVVEAGEPLFLVTGVVG